MHNDAIDNDLTGAIDLSGLQGLPFSKLTGKPVIHFAHANGVPSRVYEGLFAKLAALFTVEYIPILGFDDAGKQAYPIDNHWKSLTQQVIDSVEAANRKHDVPVIGLGHSLGALCTLQALYKSSHLFSQAVLMDPPLISGHRSLMWHLAKLLSPKLVDKMSPAGISKFRRDVWASREEAKNLLRNKSFFKHFEEDSFAAYIEHGLRLREDGKVTLTIPKEVEVAVFRTNPSWYWLTPNKPPTKPITLLIGDKSLFYQYKFPQKIHKRLSIPFKLHKGGHMFPLEHPDSVVELITKTITEQI